MAITTIGLTGFEHGFIGTGATAGGGLFDTITGTGFSASTTAPRNGSYCAHAVVPASTITVLGNNMTAAAKVVMRFGVKVSARPSSGTPDLAGSFDGIGKPFNVSVSSAGVLSAQLTGGTAQAGATIDTTNWHLIELQFDATGKTLDWKVDGVAQTRATTAAGVGSPTSIRLGPVAVGAAFTVDYDDVIIGTWTVAGTDWYGDGKVLAQLAGMDNAHGTPTNNFSSGDAGTLYTSTQVSSFQMVDDPPATDGWTATRSTTDNIAMRAAVASAYLEHRPQRATLGAVGASNNGLTGRAILGAAAGNFRAQSFKATSSSITAVMMALAQASSPTGSVDIRIVNDNGGVPGTTVIASTTKVASSLPLLVTNAPLGDVGLTASGLTPGTTYWLQLLTATGYTGTVTWQQAGNTYADGTSMSQALTDSGFDLGFEITFAGDTTATAVKALMSYSSSTATANLAACDVRNSAGTVTPLWGTTGGTGADYSEITNFFKSAIVTRPAAGWTAAEVNAIRFRFGGCTSVDISPVPTVQALMLEVDWPIVPTATSVARVSLATGATPLTRTAHTIKVRARKASGTGTVLLSAALYEGATNRSGDLTTSALTTSLADYTLAIPDASAANITDYSDLELRFWANAATGDTVAVEVARIALITPAGAGGPGSNPLAGAVNVAVSDTGSLTVDRPLAGAVNVAVAVTGTLTNTPPTLPLAGAVNVTVSDTGTLTSRATLAGAVNVAVADTGTLTSRAGLVSAGTNVATVTSSPAITVASPLVGAGVSVAVSDTGTLIGRAVLAGAVTGAVSVTGTLTNTPASLPLAGAVNITTVAGSPAVTVAAPLAAAVNVATAVTGTAVKHNPLTGASDVAVSSTGTLTNTPPGGAPVAGDVAVTASVTGTLSVTARLVGAGVTVAVSDTGTVTGRAALAGGSSVTVSDTGTLINQAALSGAVNVASTVTGNLTNTLPGGAAVAGFVLVAVSITGTAVKQNPLAGAGTVDTAVTGTAASLRPLAAAVNVGTAVTGTLTVTTPLVGAGVNVVVSDTGTLTSRATLAGAVAVAASVTGTLTNTPAGGTAVAGDVTVAVAVTGTAVKHNPLAAAVNVDTSATGSLLLTKPLAGQVTVAVTLTGAGGSLRALAGQALVGTLVTGSVSARAVLAADVNVVTTLTGQVLVIKPLSGAVLTAVTAGTATLTNTGPIVSVSILEAASYAAVGEDAGAGSVLTAGNTSTVVERAMGASVPSSGGSVALIE